MENQYHNPSLSSLRAHPTMTANGILQQPEGVHASSEKLFLTEQGHFTQELTADGATCANQLIVSNLPPSL